MILAMSEQLKMITEMPTLIGVIGIVGMVLAAAGVVLALVHASRRAGLLLMILTFVVSLPMVFVLRESLLLINSTLIDKLDFNYNQEVFNIIGFSTPLVVAAVLVLLLSAKRVKLLAPALLLVALGSPVLIYNFYTVTDEVIFAEQVAEDEAARLEAIAKKEELEEEQPQAISAFESAEDMQDRGGATEAEFQEKQRILAEGRAAENKKSWKDIHKKQEREAGNEREDAQGVVDVVAEQEEKLQQEAARVPLTIDQARRADTLNYYLLYLSQFALSLLLLVGILEYIRRICEPESELFALPLFGKWMELFFTRARFVRIKSDEDALVRRYMKRMVGRGDSFIYLGPRNLWPEGECRTWPFIGKKPVHCWTPSDEDYDVELILESAWFRRLNVVMTGGDQAEAAFLKAMDQVMRYRENSRARNFGRTNLVLWVDEMQSESLLKEMMIICRRTDMRLWLFGSSEKYASLEAEFDVLLEQDQASRLSQSPVPELDIDLALSHKVEGSKTLRKVNHQLPPSSLLNNHHHFAEASGKAEAEL